MLNRRFLCYVFLIFGWSPTLAIYGDDESPEKPKIEVPTIADEPKLVDPAILMPDKLAAAATVDLSDSSLNDVIDWLRDKQKIVVLTEQTALSDAGVVLGDPVSDRLEDAPVYLLLNRLRSLGLGWYYDDDILHLAPIEAIEERLTTIPHNLGDLIDAEFDPDTLSDLIERTIEPQTWDTVGGNGGLNFVGDVMFVRQTDNVHRKVQGLLMSLREHGRQTFILDPPQHQLLRKKLEDSVGVDFNDTPLDAAVKQLAEKTKIDIRLDIPALRSIRVRERQPITLQLSDRKLKTILHAMIVEFGLTWILRDGVLWITSVEEAEAFQKTAVYDVRDLCRDGIEADALRDAVMSQTPLVWDEVGGPASIAFAKSGVMVINAQENVLMEVLALLETYRTALRASKQRDRDSERNEVVTVYYRLHANVAENLRLVLPKLANPDTWKSDTKPDAIGEIVMVASPPDLFTSDGKLAISAANGDTAKDQATVVVARAVLIIRQTRAVHDNIVQVIDRIESGDPRYPSGQGLGGGGMGGGFGGGFFSVSPDRLDR